MKSMNEQEYRNAEGISRSLLSDFDDHPMNIKEPRERVESNAFRIGSAFDALMFQSADEWNERYYVATTTPPTGMMESMVAAAINIKLADPFGDVDVAELAFEASDYKPSYKKTALKQFETFEDYINERCENDGKVCISQEEYEMMSRMKMSCLSDSSAKRFFVKDAHPDHELKFQVPVFWEQGGVTCKALLDMVLVDHAEKKIYPVDLKTTSSSVYYFASSFIKYKYYLQASMYTAAIEELFINEISEGYTVENFKFVVVSTTGRNDVLTYTVSDEDLQAGDYGYTDLYGNYHRGWITLLEDLSWHYEHDLWKHPRNVYAHQNDMPLNCTAPWKQQLQLQ
jgi:hypothetical protein